MRNYEKAHTKFIATWREKFLHFSNSTKSRKASHTEAGKAAINYEAISSGIHNLNENKNEENDGKMGHNKGMRGRSFTLKKREKITFSRI